MRVDMRFDRNLAYALYPTERWYYNLFQTMDSCVNQSMQDTISILKAKLLGINYIDFSKKNKSE